LGQLFDELKRRNVIRVAVAYLVATWLVLQVADLVLDNIGAPAWVIQAIMLLFALGLPLALIFAWAYEITPEGLKREKEVDRDRSVTHETGHKLDQITIALLVAVVGLVAAERFLFPRVEGPEFSPTQVSLEDRSIAVLAFEDLSEAGDQEYFADGLSEELLNVLAKVPDLKVAGRTSSFAFKGKDTDLREIGEILNVAHILEGSVRKAGNRIRVTAQLINAETGFHLFSESYDRNLDDIFMVQDELATRIGAALQSELIGTTAVPEVAPTPVAGYDLYLEARQLIHTRGRPQMESAVTLLDQALAIDPDYVPALAQKALVVYLLSDAVGAYGDIPVREALAVSRPLLDRALALDPRNGEALAVSGLIMDEEGASLDQQITTLRRAVALNPGFENAKNWLSSALTESNDYEESLVLLEGIVERDPVYGPAFNNLIQAYSWRREFDKAEALIDRVERITGPNEDIDLSRGTLALNRGELADSIRHLERAYEINPSATITRLFYGFSLESIGEYERLAETSGPWRKTIAYLLLGERELAARQFASVIEEQGFREAVELAAYYYVDIGDYETLVAEIEANFGSINALLAAEPKTDGWGADYMSDLAWACLQLGRQQDFEKVMTAMRHALDVQRNKAPDFMPVVWSEADFAALAGDADALIRNARHMFKVDAVDVRPFSAPWFEPFAADENLHAVGRDIVARANDERAKLGLDPYQPLLETN